MRGFFSFPPLGLSQFGRRWIGSIAACVPAGLVVVGLAVACSKDSTTGPGLCDGTCITVSNQSALSVDEVYFRSCTDATWGVNRLSGAVILQGDEREWSVTAGCWDILARGGTGSDLCSKLENDVQVSSGERHATVFAGCGNAQVRLGMPDS
jgi:hypothetical protein